MIPLSNYVDGVGNVLLSPCDKCDKVFIEDLYGDYDCKLISCKNKLEYNKSFEEKYGKPYYKNLERSI